MSKEFRKIPSLDFRYEITRDGIVRNVKSKKIKKQFSNWQGYLRTSYRVNRTNPHYNKTQGWDRPVHILVMECWGPPKPDWADCIDHIDQNKQNNDISNLRWATYSQNVQNQDLKERGRKSSVTLRNGNKIKRCPVILKNSQTGEEHYFKSRFTAAEWLIANGLTNTKNPSGLSRRIQIQKHVHGFDICNIMPRD